METAEITSADKANMVREYEAHTQGTCDTHAFNPFCPSVVYTDGAKYVADSCQAHWLLDLIASHQPEIKRKHPRGYVFQVWELRREEAMGAAGEDRWVAQAWSDTPHKSTSLARQAFPYSDFPRELLPFTSLWVEYTANADGNEVAVILLGAEH